MHDVDALLYKSLAQVTLAGGAVMGVSPCQATVIKYEPSLNKSTQPRPPTMAPTDEPDEVSAAPCKALHHSAESICWRFPETDGHVMPDPT